MTLTEAKRKLELEKFHQRRRQHHLDRALGGRELPPDDIRDWTDEFARQNEGWFRVSLATMLTGLVPPRALVDQIRVKCQERLDAIALGESLDSGPLFDTKLLPDGKD